MKNVCDPSLAVKVDVEIMVFMLHFYREGKSLCIVDDIGWNFEYSTL
jgi:hypothetical protein